ncbi:MAG: hypothetical protein QM688_04900 [Sphingomonas bacterium]
MVNAETGRMTPSWEELQPGQRVGPIEHDVTPAMVDAFLATMGAATDRRALAGEPMPPTLLATDYVLLLHGVLELGHGLMRSHETIVHRPVPVGARVEMAGEIIDKFVRKGRNYWTLEYHVAANGERCITYIVTCSVN